MRLTQYTDYSLRVLIYLALAAGRLSTIDEIARGYSISTNHLMKIVRHLGALGFIQTVRGRNGGMRLAKPPEELRIGDIVRAVEPDFRIVECFGDSDNPCAIEQRCSLQGVLGDALRSFLGVLDQYTLADFVHEPKGLRELVQISEPEPIQHQPRPS
jgi:Rrf2 family transcriptional regulator, nitric oxide-sensitive transcriptional repressor